VLLLLPDQLSLHQVIGVEVPILRSLVQSTRNEIAASASDVFTHGLLKLRLSCAICVRVIIQMAGIGPGKRMDTHAEHEGIVVAEAALHGIAGVRVPVAWHLSSGHTRNDHR
jgi:hypothetical protein